MLLIVLSVAVVAQSQVDEGTANLPGTGVISGRVITENGQPLENVTVYVHAWNSQGQPNIAATDSDGKFQVTGLDPALYLVQASALSYVAVSREPGNLPAYHRIGDSVTITLLKGGVITGTVTSASGEPLVMTGVRAVLIRNPEGQRYPIRPIERTTDDRGMYRLYGLQPGTYLVSAGGRGAFGFYGNTYDTDMPTYAPSATRDTATEINVRSGEERGGVDIRYRGEPGHVVSGSVSGPTAATGPYSGANINLTQILNGTRVGGPIASQASESRGFLIYGVGDGDYELTAVSALSLNEVAMSEPLRLTVKGADVTGLELITKPLGSISGHLVLENSTASECKGKRKPLFSETLILRQDNSKELARDDLRIIFSARQMPLDKSGDVLFANLVAGQYRFDLQFFAKYWYLKTIVQPAATVPAGSTRSALANRSLDAARNWQPQTRRTAEWPDVCPRRRSSVVTRQY